MSVGPTGHKHPTITIPQKKTDSPPTGGHQLPIAHQLGVGLSSLSPSLAGTLAGSCAGLVQAAVAAVSSVQSQVMPRRLHFTALFSSPGSYILSVLPSLMFPEHCG